MVYPIVKFGDPVLEREAETVTEFDTPELHKLLEDMFESMYAAKGVGLAAPQIGFGKKIAVIDCLQRREPGGQAGPDQPQNRAGGRQAGGRGRLPQHSGLPRAGAARQARDRARAERQGRGIRNDRRRSAGARLPARNRSPSRQALHHPHQRAQARPDEAQNQKAAARRGVGAESRADAPGLSRNAGLRRAHPGTSGGSRAPGAGGGHAARPSARPRPARRAASPVKQAALRLGLPSTSRSACGGRKPSSTCAALAPDAMVVVGYGQIIPQSVIDIRAARHHQRARLAAAEVPRRRRPSSGPSPTAKRAPASPPCASTRGSIPAISCCKAETESARRRTPSNWARGWPLWARTCWSRRWTAWRPGASCREKQDAAQATYAPLLKKEDGRIDWSQSGARCIHNRVRGLQPWPGAYTAFRGQTLHIWKSRPRGNWIRRTRPGHAGRLASRLTVSCGAGALELVEVQLEGRKRMAGRRFRQRPAPDRE